MNRKNFNKPHSMFLGRYQPLHDGHIKLIRTALDKGENVCIAMRSCDRSKSNPYGFNERCAMFHKVFVEEIEDGRMVFINMPNIMKVCHGRKVGWSVEEIKLDEETEAISGTKIRNG